MSAGYTCLNCGVLVPWDQTHTHFCSATRSSVTTPGPLPTYSVGPRKYRIRGTISQPGKSYAVDLVVEALP